MVAETRRGEPREVDLLATASGMGSDTLIAARIEELEAALRRARASSRTTVVRVRTEVSALDSTRNIRAVQA